MPAVESRYAEGLVAALKNGGDADKTIAALTDFSLAMENSAELKHFMLNPVVPAEAKKSAIKQLCGGQAGVLPEHFLCLLVDKSRLSRLSGIIAACKRIRAASGGVLLVKVTSAKPLDQNQLDEMSELYRKKYGAANVTVENLTDPALLGGLRVQIGDTLVDASLASKLRGLASAVGAINF